MSDPKSILTDLAFSEYEALKISPAEVLSAAEYTWSEGPPQIDETGEIVAGGLRQVDR